MPASALLSSRTMRLWSIHPKYLDAKGLVALWREGLLARAVLLGRTKGYRHHPQLERFRLRSKPVAVIDAYLYQVLLEAQSRGYEFDATKIQKVSGLRRSAVHDGQIAHEWQHLLSKLHTRDRARWHQQRTVHPECHPCFRIVPGGVESWERLP